MTSARSDSDDSDKLYPIPRGEHVYYVERQCKIGYFSRWKENV